MCAVFGILFETEFEITLDHTLELCARELFLELGRADGALLKHRFELLRSVGDIRISIQRQIVDGGDVGIFVEPICNRLNEQSFFALVLIVEPALVGFFVIVIQKMRLQQLVHEGRHGAQDLLADHRGPHAQRELFRGLLVGDVFR